MMENVRPHIGWMGVFTTDQAPGCLPNGTRIEKSGLTLRERYQIGTVLGSVIRPEKGPSYFVEWDSNPQVAVLVPARDLRQATP